MDKSQTKLNYRPLIASLAAVSAVFTGYAQGEDEDEIFELSPFVVSSEGDSGYRASETLMGSRLRTPLTDIGSAISVMTEQFLEDTNSTNLRDALVYGTGTEVNGIGGNFSTTESGQLPSDESFASNQTTTRVRGLASATLTRNYFTSGTPFDSYNSKRVEINRGSNAFLFGIGSPAGIINYGTSQASTSERFGSVSAQYDRFGSVRLTLDANQPVIEDELAIRVAALRDDTKFQQDPAFNDDHRIYVATTYSPSFLQSESGFLSGGTFRASYERGEIEGNNPRSLPPKDNLVRWFEPTPEMLSVGIPAKKTWNVATGLTGASFSDGIFPLLGLRRGPTAIFPDPNSPVAQDYNQDAVGRQMTLNSSSILEPVGRTTSFYSPGNYPDSLRRMGYANANFYSNPTLNDRTVFDFRNSLIDGDNKRVIDEFDTIDASFEQLFFDNKMGLELAYHKGDRETRSHQVFSEHASIEMDINTHLVDGTPNPHFGKPYMSNGTVSTANWSLGESEATRATAFIEFDPQDRFDADWMKWLGKHTLSFLYQDQELVSEGRSGRMFYIPEYPWPYGNNQRTWSVDGKPVGILQYLTDESVADRSSASGLNLSRITNNFTDLPSLINGQPFYLREQEAGSDWDFVQANIVNSRYDLSDHAQSAGKSKRINESKGANLQSKFLEGALILNAGVREEDVENFGAEAPVSTDGQGIRLVDDPSYAFSDTSESGGSESLFAWNAVTHLPRRWFDSVPNIDRVSFFYNESENISPPREVRISPFGEKLPPPSGDTTDFGFSLEFGEGKGYARVNWYETSQGNVKSEMTGVVSAVLGLHQRVFDAVVSGYADDNDGDGFPDNYVAPPQSLLDLYNVEINNGTMTITNPGVISTTEYVSKGVEIEMAYNPTPNWRLAFNAARQSSTRSNSGADVEQLIYGTPLANGRNLVDTWKDLYTIPIYETASLEDELTPDTSGTLRAETIRALVNPFNTVRLQDGIPAQELREWRFNIVTNYSITDGALSGVNFGAAYRWQDEVAIGHKLTTDTAGDPIIDVNNPYYGPSEDNLDLWVGYSQRILNDKVDWKIQLNLRNAIPGDDLIPVFAQPNGSLDVFRISESRLWTLRNTFDF